jgi:hypothetical protein
MAFASDKVGSNATVGINKPGTIAGIDASQCGPGRHLLNEGSLRECRP